MSTNCIKCLRYRATGPDQLCVECRISVLIQELRDWLVNDEHMVAVVDEVANRLDELTTEKNRLRSSNAALVAGNHDWFCGCGHWNGCNLSNCSVCNRTAGESLREAYEDAKSSLPSPPQQQGGGA